MSSGFEDPDSSLADFLLAFDEALANGKIEEFDSAFDLSPALREKLERYRKSLQLLDTLRVNQMGQETIAASSDTDEKTSEVMKLVLACLSSPQSPDELGRLGGYRVLEVLGAGGMGVVFRAQDPDLERYVALKVMKPTLGTHAAPEERFRREARSTAALRHDNVVTIYQVGADRGTTFLAMEFLEGLPLDKWLEGKFRPTSEEVIQFAQEITSGLAAAHEKGLIHRDIKPANLWLETRHDQSSLASASSDGPVANLPLSGFRGKILDFGLARLSTEDVNLTQRGAILGTPAYMAPEQMRAEEVDARCDLFSLGSVLYRMLTGEAPFKGNDPVSIGVSLAMTDPVPPHLLRPGVREDLSHLIMELLAKKRDDRPASARALLEKFNAIAQATTPKLPPAPSLHRANEAMRIEQTATMPAPPSPKPRRPAAPSSRKVLIRSLSLVSLLAAMVAGAVYLSPFIIRVPTDKGTLVIESEDPNIEVTVRKNGAVVWDKTGKRTLDLSVGNYEIELAERKDGLRLSTRSFTISRDNRTVVRVYLELPQAKKKPSSDPGQPGQNSALSPFDTLKREDIDPYELSAAGNGDPTKAPKDLVAILGDSRLKHWGRITALAYSPDGTRIAAQDSSGCVRIWDDKTGKLVLAFHTRNDSRNRLCFSPDGNRLVLGGQDGHVDIRDAHTGEMQLLLYRGVGVEKTKRAETLAWSPDGKWIAAGFADGVLVFWDAASGNIAHSNKGHAASIPALSFSRDSKLLASGSADHTLKLWDVATGKQRAVLEGHTTQVANVDFSPDSKLLTSCDNETILIWDAATGKKLRACGRPDPYFLPRSLCFDVKGKQLYGIGSASKANLLTTWDAATGAIVRTVNVHAVFGRMVLRPDGNRLAVANADGDSFDTGIRLFDLATDKEVFTFAGHNSRVSDLVFHPDGRHIATASADDTLKIWDLASRKVIRTILHPPCRNPGGRQFLTSVAYSPDGKLLAGAGVHNGCKEGMPVWVHDADTGKLRETFYASGSTCASFSPDGKLLAVDGLGNRNIILWDVQTGHERHNMSTGKYHNLLAFSPDSRLLATGGDELRLWDCATGKVKKLFDEIPFVRAVAFSPDGKSLLVAAGRTSVPLQILNVETGQQITEMKIPGLVANASFNPTGDRVAFSCTDNTVRLWDVAGNKELKKWQLQPNFDSIAPTTVRFSPDGRYLLTGNGNGTIYVLRLAAPPRKTPQPVTGPGPFELFKREDIDPYELSAAGNGDSTKAPKDLVAILGDSRLKHWGLITALAYSPDGTRIAAQDSSGCVRIWDDKTGKLVLAFHTRNDSRNRLCFSPDGNRLVLGGQDGRLDIHDALNGEVQRPLLRGADMVKKIRAESIACSPDSKWIAAGFADGGLVIWDAGTGNILHSIEAHSASISSLAFNRDSKLLASGSADHMVTIWDITTGKQRAVLEGHAAQVNDVDFSLDSQLLISTDNETILIRDMATGKKLRVCAQPDTKYTLRSMCLDAKSKRIHGIGHSPGSIWLSTWDVDTGNVLRSVKIRGASRMSLRPDGKRVAVIFSDGETFDTAIRLYDLSTDKDVFSFAGHTSRISDLVFHPDGRRLATSSSDDTLKIWDLTSRQVVRTILHPPSPAGGRQFFTSVAFSPDGKLIAGAGLHNGWKEGTPTWIHDAETGKLHQTIYASGQSRSARFSPDGKLLAVDGSWNASANRNIILWDVEAGHDRHVLHTEKSPGLLAFSPDSRLLATGGDKLRLWDCATGKELHLFEEISSVRGLDFSLDGKTLLVGADRTLLILNVQTGKQMSEMKVRDIVVSAVFSPNGDQVAFCCTDNTVRLWDVAAKRELKKWQLQPHYDSIAPTTVRFTPDGRYLLTGNGNGTIYVFRLTPAPVATSSLSPLSRMRRAGAIVDTNHTAVFSRN